MDRKANCASYRKRLSATTSHSNENDNRPDLEESQNDSYEQPGEKEMDGNENENKCCVTLCSEDVMHSLRKKWLIKTKKQVSKIIEINDDIVNNVVNFVPICDTHYQLINHLMVCAMCKRKLPKNHIFYIAQVSIYI